MKESKKKKKVDPLDGFDICNACSSTDCTGLIPSLPQTDAEIDSYSDLYNFLPPVVRSKIKDDIP